MLFKRKQIQSDPAELEELQKVMEKLDSSIDYPVSIAPQNIMRRIREKQKPAVYNRRPIKAVVSTALCLILVIAAVIPMAVLHGNKKTVIKTESLKPPVNQYDDISAKSYDQIKAIINKLNTQQRTGTTQNTKAAATTKSSADAAAVSQTNIQVSGVDEADIVKNDDQYLYMVSNGNVYIIDAQSPAKMNIVSTISYTGFEFAQEVFLFKNSLVILVNSYGSIYDSGRVVAKGQTIAEVYDISDHSHPKKTRSFTQDGSYISSRMNGAALYLITNYYVPNSSSEKVKNETYIPKCGNTSAMKAIPAQSIYIPAQPDAPSYIVVSSIDITDNEKKVSTCAALSGGYNVYSSLENLYVTSQKYNYKKNNINSKSVMTSTDDVTTCIVRFSLKNGVVSYAGTASVKGSVINRYAMDESSGHFRIATTTYGDKNIMINHLFVLDDKMKQTGKIDDLAPGERIYSVRYMGNRAYIVTFKTVDPLFAIDLSNPAKPKVLGQLKIPGFSSYLHPYSENLLIGLGNDTAEENGRAHTEGLKLSLFDVSDPLKPREISNTKYGKRNSYSAALYDSHAFLFSKEKNIIGFPVNSYNASDLIYKYLVYKINPEKGFELKGNIQVEGNNNFQSEIKRGAFIDNTLFTFSDQKIMSFSLADFQKTGELKLPASQGGNHYGFRCYD